MHLGLLQFSPLDIKYFCGGRFFLFSSWHLKANWPLVWALISKALRIVYFKFASNLAHMVRNDNLKNVLSHLNESFCEEHTHAFTHS